MPETTAPTTTSSSTSTTTSTSTTSTTTLLDPDPVSDDDSTSSGWWVLLALLALAAAAGAAWYFLVYSKQRQALTDWEKQARRALRDAQRAHDSSVDLLARWSSLTPDQLADHWSQEMSRLDQVRYQFSTLLAATPQNLPATPLNDVANAVDDLHIALGSVDPVSAWAPQPVEAVTACDVLQQAITTARTPPQG